MSDNVVFVAHLLLTSRVHTVVVKRCHVRITSLFGADGFVMQTFVPAATSN